MTLHTARRILKEPQFGNEEHLLAVKVLSLYEQAVALNNGSEDLPSLKCETCKGVGERYCHDCGRHHDCACCDGTGEYETDEPNLNEDVLTEIIDLLKSDPPPPAAAHPDQLSMGAA